MCLVLSAQVVKFQVRKVVREDMWENIILKICLILFMKNTGKNCPFGILSTLIKIQFVSTAAP